MLREAGYADTDVAFVNAVRCRPRNNATPSMYQVRACRPFLLRTIGLVVPRVVLGLGGSALRSLTNDGANNVTAARGRILTVTGLPECSLCRWALNCWRNGAVDKGRPARQRYVAVRRAAVRQPAPGPDGGRE